MDSFVEFIVIRKLFFVKNPMYFRCYRLEWNGVGLVDVRRSGREVTGVGGGELEVKKKMGRMGGGCWQG